MKKKSTYILSFLIFFSQVFAMASGLSAGQAKQLREQVYNPSLLMKQRWSSLMNLVSSEKEKAWPDLVAASKSSAWYMRNAALVGMSHLDVNKAKSFAKELIKDKSLVVRSAAVQVFEQKLDASDRIMLWSEVKEKYNFRNRQSLWIRSQIVKLLAMTALRSEQLKFQELLSDSDVRVRSAAVQGYEKIFGVKFPSANLDQKVALWKDFSNVKSSGQSNGQSTSKSKSKKNLNSKAPEKSSKL